MEKKQSLYQSNRIYQIPIERIAPNPRQPRRHFDERSLRELADSIRQHGVLQPLSVQKEAGGYLLVAYTEKEWAQFQENLKVQHALGIDAKALDLQQAKEIVPFLNTEGMFGATFCQKDGHANPFHCTMAYAQGAARLGVDILTYTEVTGLRTQSGRITGVETANGDFFGAGLVVNCANVRAPGLANLVGEDIPVVSERHQALVTEPVAPLLRSMVMSFHRSFYVQQTPHGSFVMGIGPHEESSFNIRSSWQFLEENCAVICETLPLLRKLNVVRQWAGSYDLSPDHIPVIDEAKAAKGFYSVCGFSGHGFMVAPRIAILVANHLTGQKDDLDIKTFSQERYQKGVFLMEPSVV